MARAWFIEARDTREVEGGAPPVIPVPDAEHTFSIAGTWPGGFVASLQMRAVEAPVPGRATAWLSTDRALVEGEPVSPHAAYIALVDTANGVAVRESPADWVFPNVDLTVHLYRRPRGPWVGLDSTITFGPAGHGLTSSVLHDGFGPLGRAEQILTVRPVV